MSILDYIRRLVSPKPKPEPTPQPQNSNEPWVEMKSIETDPEHGIRLELDWNDAFVQYLRQAGYTGRDEETIVRKWLASIMPTIGEQLEQTSLEKSNQPKDSEFT